MGAGSAHPDREFLLGWVAGERDIGGGVVECRDCGGIVGNGVSWTAYSAGGAANSGAVRRCCNIGEGISWRGGSSASANTAFQRFLLGGVQYLSDSRRIIDFAGNTGASVVVSCAGRVACGPCDLQPRASRVVLVFPTRWLRRAARCVWQRKRRH
jgi:hypothetical protein